MGRGVWRGCPQKNLGFCSFQNGAFLYTISKVLFAVISRERYVITIFLTIDGDTGMKTSSVHQSRKLIAIQSVSSNSRQFHSYSRNVLRAKIILCELQTQAAL